MLGKMKGFFKSPKKTSNDSDTTNQSAPSPGEDFDAWYKNQFAAKAAANPNNNNVKPTTEKETKQQAEVETKQPTFQDTKETKPTPPPPSDAAPKHHARLEYQRGKIENYDIIDPKRNSFHIASAKDLAQQVLDAIVDEEENGEQTETLDTSQTLNLSDVSIEELPISAKESTTTEHARKEEEQVKEKVNIVDKETDTKELKITNQENISSAEEDEDEEGEMLIAAIRNELILSENNVQEEEEKEEEDNIGNVSIEETTLVSKGHHSSIQKKEMVSSPTIPEVRRVKISERTTDNNKNQHQNKVKSEKKVTKKNNGSIVAYEDTSSEDDDDDDDDNTANNDNTDNNDVEKSEIAIENRISDALMLTSTTGGAAFVIDPPSVHSDSNKNIASNFSNIDTNIELAELKKKLNQVTVERDEARAKCVRLCHEASSLDFRIQSKDMLANKSSENNINRSLSASTCNTVSVSATRILRNNNKKNKNTHHNHTNNNTATNTTDISVTSSQWRPIPSFSQAFEDLLGYVPESRTPNEKNDTEHPTISSKSSSTTSTTSTTSPYNSTTSPNNSNFSKHLHSPSKSLQSPPHSKRRPRHSPLRHAQWEGDRSKSNGTSYSIHFPDRTEKECGCKSKTRLLGLMRQHESVHVRLRAAITLQKATDKKHRNEMNKMKIEILKGPEAALQRLELQNARLRRMIIMAQSGGSGNLSNLAFSSFTATPSVAPPSVPPPSRRGKGTGRIRNGTSSKGYNFSCVKRKSVLEVSGGSSLSKTAGPLGVSSLNVPR